MVQRNRCDMAPIELVKSQMAMKKEMLMTLLALELGFGNLTNAFFGKHGMRSVWGPNHHTANYSLLLGDARMCP